MKLLFVQLSDMHCTESDRGNTEKIKKAAAALATLGKIDGAIFIFSGDLADKAKKEQFSVGKEMMGCFTSNLSDKLDCGFIRTMIIPGNHDIDLSDTGCRVSKDIIGWKDNGQLEDHLVDELSRLREFFRYSKTKHCFAQNKFCDTKIFNICGITVQCCLLNSALFSTRTPDDKELHYLPQSIMHSLNRKDDADIKITIMHHHFEWCEWNTKEMIKKAISSDDITFFGHDHKSEAIHSSYSDGKEHHIIMGGEFTISVEKEGAFNAIVYDTDKNIFDRFVFIWDKEHNCFTKKPNGSFKKRAHNLSPTSDYLDVLMKDPQNICDRFDKYYVFPKLTAEGEVFETIDNGGRITTDDIFNALIKDKAIRITGEEGSGKSSLLRYLYNEAIKRGFFPLLIEKRDYRDSRIEKMFTALFERQYTLDQEILYDEFEQKDNSKKIIFIDDADLIKNAKARENLFNTILDNNYLLIYTTKEKDQDIEEIVKKRIEGKEISTLCIPLMFKESRDSLIESVGTIYKKSEEEIEAIKTAFDYMVQSQSNLFLFTPSNTLQYIKFFIQNGSRDKSTYQSLSMVFENNIRNSLLLACKADEKASLYLSVLEYIADTMYFELKQESIDYSAFSNILENYKKKRRAEINGPDFLETCTQAHLFLQEKDDFKVRFYNKNTYAYFVARAINREFEKDYTKTDKIEFVMKHICFGINDTIVLFLSFIRSNTTLIMNIAQKANELLSDYPEWDFDKNLPFLKEETSLSNTVPRSDEIKKNTDAIEKVEKSRHNAIQFRGIFDYSEEEVRQEKYVIAKAFKYVQLVSRALVDQYGSLEGEEIDNLLNAIFKIPQKIVYAILQPFQDNNERIIQSILQFVKEKMPDERVDENLVRQMLADTATVLALNILNDIAFNSANTSTITVLRTGPDDTSNYRILKLMMEENTDNTSVFIGKAIELREQFNNNPYAIHLIAQISRKHIMYHKNIDHRQIDQLISGKVLSNKSKATFLIDKGTKDNSQ